MAVETSACLHHVDVKDRLVAHHVYSLKDITENFTLIV